ncbi:MAG: hypothetical protein A2173_10020 [Planctomycetes bacterium RBG_13_44_8b]|nr:MAG: hypothetical protein A2173_10020 [Planctomycetes bacterium RBG_13_44_8b]
MTSNAGLSHTPFKFDASCPSVFWASGDDPYNNTRKALANINLSVSKNKRVLLKPNVGRNVEPNTGITTHPEVVAAAIDAFREAEAEVAVGESPITGVKASEAFENSGIAAVARERNCRLLDMDAQSYVPLEIPDGVAVKSLKLCSQITEFDIVVSIPVMKTHMHTVVTLSVKNMKGCLWRRSKVDLHMLPEVGGRSEKPLDIAIADMASVLRPHLSIIDGTVGMEGLGPSAGKPKALGIVLAGVDAFATDSIACELMGISASDVPHLRIGAERGYGVIDPDKIRVFPENWRDIRNPFALPPDKLSIEFPGFIILDKQSCSACQSTLLMFLKRYGKELRSKMPEKKDIIIAIGKGHSKLPDGTLCIGNCMSEHKGCGIFVPGCPPVASEILNEYFASEK